MQYFHWYYPADGSLWKKITEDVAQLSKIGITALWLPPATKGAIGGMAIGYDAYDLWDMGEFDQKGSVRTKYGTRQEYLDAINAAHANNISIIADVVLNHKSAGDEKEKITVVKMNPKNRVEKISEPFQIESWTKFTFPGRNGAYSSFIWDHNCFSGVDYAADINESGIFSIQNEYGEGWQDGVADELGNYDFLICNDIEYRNAAVKEEIKRWAEWYITNFDLDGFRVDAIKHIPVYFINELLDHIAAHTKKQFFVVGEYWDKSRTHLLQQYIDNTKGRMQLFDSPLHNNFHEASKAGKAYDMRSIFDNSAIKSFPQLAVTFVANHDTQPLQALEAPVESWFKPLAYAIILYQKDGIPCVFYADMYGAKYKGKGNDDNEYDIEMLPVHKLSEMIWARKNLAYGIQNSWFDHPNCIGFTREGNEESENSGIAVIMSNGEEGFKKMYIGKHFARKTFVDLLENRNEKPVIDENGEAFFNCNAGSVSVYITTEAFAEMKSAIK